MREIQDGSVDLVISDPPYFKVVGEKWDFQWRTEDDYIEWSSKWIKAAARTLRLGGTFYVFGYFRMLSRILPALEQNGLELRQQIVLNKGIRAVSGRATRAYKLFPNVTESILFLYKDPKPYIRRLLKEYQRKSGLSAKEINRRLGVKSNGGGMWSIYTGHNVCKQIPTEECWNKLESILGFDVPYSRIAQTFYPQIGITDVWSDIDFYSEKRLHPTQKPQSLIDRLILSSSNIDDIILDPFMGCGSVCVSAINNKRGYIGFEKDTEYFNIAKQRIDSYIG